jgi:hypothetical protein
MLHNPNSRWVGGQKEAKWPERNKTMNYADQDVCACDPAQTVATMRMLLVSVGLTSLALFGTMIVL